MRFGVIVLALAVLLTARAGAAQTAPAQPQMQGSPQSALFNGTLDVGGLFTATEGDEARYERYRDTRDGVYSGVTLSRKGERYLFDAKASHIGYRDQRYAASFAGSHVNAVFDWTSVPLNYSYLTRSPYVTTGSTLSLDAGVRRAVQGPTNATNDGSAVGVPCAPGAPPASCATPALAAQAIANPSIYNAIATQFDLRHRRDTAAFGLTYAPTRAIDVEAKFTSAKREGQQPWGASFAFNEAVEVPLPIDQRTNDLSLGASWADDTAMFRVGWDGSWFNNAFQSLVWDNPMPITDFDNGLALPNGPYDANGYSNGNGPAQGRLSLSPDNMMHVVSTTGLYKFPGRTTLNGAVQLSLQKQNDALIPWTSNAVINTPRVFAAFPHLAVLPRATADAEATGLNTLLNLTTRPVRAMNITVRYRYNERDVQTPVFDATEYVRFDAVPEEIEEGFSHQYDTSRHLFDANVSFTPNRFGTFRVGYGHEDIERHGRGFADVGEHILRLSYDAYSNQHVSVRAGSDVGRRRGEGFVETGVDYEFGPGGSQPTLRYYDEADRDRMRGTLLVTVTPRDTLDLFVQFAGGKDEYMADDSVPVSRPGELFGLHEQKVTSWSVGASFQPTDVIAVGASYGRDTFGSLQLSRNANPPPDPTWTDPSRDWTLDNDDRVNTFNVTLDLLRAIRNTDIRFGYDYSDSRNSFVHGGPRIAALTSLGQFLPLPDVENTWHRGAADVQYFFTSRVGVGVGYDFEKLDIVDFNTIDTSGINGFAEPTGEPRLDWLGALTLGYGNRPYTGHTGYVRLLYRF